MGSTLETLGSGRDAGGVWPPWPSLSEQLVTLPGGATTHGTTGTDVSALDDYFSGLDQTWNRDEPPTPKRGAPPHGMARIGMVTGDG